MWLLSTSRAELHYFSDPSAVQEGYAILSHTWSQSVPEQTFQQVQAIHARCQETGQIPRDLVSNKIRNTCLVAERNGYVWVWIDLCCIDKTSSAELSEAINSMFNWYILAEVCYAFLDDVPARGDIRAAGSRFRRARFRRARFRRARWHTRGWTLQELLAPALLVFLSAEWTPIGTKYELCALVGECTGISAAFLTREKSIFDASIAERMGWAAHRKTTRVEDEAYCLFGIFNINLPTLYGEGRQAFQRLQLEIAKHNRDTTLFAWGLCHTVHHELLAPMGLSEMRSESHRSRKDERFFLLAPSPFEFSRVGEVVHYTPDLAPDKTLSLPESGRASKTLTKILPKRWRTPKGPFGRAVTALPSFELTSSGMKCHFPVAEVDGITIAVLFASTHSGSHLGLLLHPAVDAASDHELPVYYVCWALVQGPALQLPRLAALGTGSDPLCVRTGGERPADRTDTAFRVLTAAADRAPAPFRVPRRLVGALAALGLQFFSGTKVVNVDGEGAEGPPLVWCEFTDTIKNEAIRLTLGVCTSSRAAAGCFHHWAHAQERYPGASGPRAHALRSEHDCAADHVASWGPAGRARVFGHNLRERAVRLSFAPCPHAGPRTLVVSVQLGGRVYERMRRECGRALDPELFFDAGAVTMARDVAGARDR